jgi:hypothetical protein
MGRLPPQWRRPPSLPSPRLARSCVPNRQPHSSCRERRPTRTPSALAPRSCPPPHTVSFQPRQSRPRTAPARPHRGHRVTFTRRPDGPLRGLPERRRRRPPEQSSASLARPLTRPRSPAHHARGWVRPQAGGCVSEHSEPGSARAVRDRAGQGAAGRAAGREVVEEIGDKSKIRKCWTRRARAQ